MEEFIDGQYLIRLSAFFLTKKLSRLKFTKLLSEITKFLHTVYAFRIGLLTSLGDPIFSIKGP